MKKFNKIISILIPFSVYLTSCSFVEGKPNIKYTEINTFDQLINCKDQNVKLTNDIDCKNRTIKAFEFDRFDGNNFTLKNCIISTSNYTEEASIFGIRTKIIENLKLDSITIKGNHNVAAAVVSASGATSISNTHVTNSKIICSQIKGKNVKKSYVGGIFGGSRFRTDYLDKADYYCNITDCSVDNVSIELTGYEKGGSYDYADLFAGGLTGHGGTINNSFVKNCTFNVISHNPCSIPYVGGLTGIADRIVNKSYSKNNTFDISATTYSKGAFSYYSTSKIYLGGIAGQLQKDKKVYCCYSDSNDFFAKSSGDVYLGGLIGTTLSGNVSESYSIKCKALISNYAEGNANSVKRRIGGLIGLSESSMIISSFAYNDCDLMEDSNGFKFKDDSKIAGLIAESNSSTITYCATYNKNLVAPIYDEFIPNKENVIFDCYITNELFNNVNNCVLIGEEFWYSPNSLIEKLNLQSEFWSLSTNQLPYLDFSLN